MAGAACYLTCLLYTLSSAQLHQDSKAYEIEDVLVEPDYRAVRLSWRYSRGPEPSGFTVRVCELSGWRSKQPCRVRHLSLDGSKQKYNVHDVLRKTNRGRYEADIYQLRMFTNYSFTVEPNTALRPLIYSNTEFERAKVIRPKNVQTTTKGFSARASRCLGNSTDVEVQTGPFFAGKISVEDVQDERCAIYGEQTDPRSVYTLTIDHSICGSKKVNNSRIETPVLVHENKELVTHNSRRFLVICNFLPDNFTIKASLNIPTVKGNNDNFHPIGHSILEEADPNEIFDDLQNNVKDSRILAEQAAVVAKTSPVKKNTTNSSHLVATVFLTTTFTIVFLGAMFWIVKVSRSMMVRRSNANNNDSGRNDANENQAEEVADSPSVQLNDEEILVQNDLALNIDSPAAERDEIPSRRDNYPIDV